MLTCKDFNAWIVCDGKPVGEHLVSVNADTNKVECWIPSEANKTFSVHWKDNGSGSHTCGYLYLDGYLVPGRFLCGLGEASREGVRTGAYTERPFMFAEQSSPITPGAQINPDAGRIVLKIRRACIDGARAANKLQMLPNPSGTQDNTSSHCVWYGDQRQTCQQSPVTWQVKPYEGNNRSYVTFVFRYRPRAFLLSQGIMPVDVGPQIPSAIKKACVINRRTVSAPVPGSSSASMTPSPTSTHGTDISKETGSTLHSAVGFSDSSIRSGTNVRACSMRAPYPGEGILDLGLDPNV